MRSYLITPTVGLVAGWASSHWAFPPLLDGKEAVWALAGGIATVSVTMLGFMLAAMAILASISHTHLVSMMRKFGHYADLLATLFGASVAMLLCLIVGLALLFGLALKPLLMAVILGLHVAALGALLDVGRKFYYTLTHLRDG